MAQRGHGVGGPASIRRRCRSTASSPIDQSDSTQKVAPASAHSATLALPVAPFEPVAFDGEAEAHVRLTHGPVSILNVLTVASRMSAAVRVADLSDGRPLSIAGATVLVLLNGTASVYAADGASGKLAPLDALVPRPRVRLVSGSGMAAVVRMENYRAWRAFSW